MTRLVSFAVLFVVAAACTDNVGPSSETSLARKWSEATIVVQEDIVNPCNGQTIHLTSQYTFVEAFEENGRERGRLRVSGSGQDDQGTHYTLRSMSRANALFPKSEKVRIHEELVGSTPGSSYRRLIELRFHLDGTARVHEVFRDRLSCR